MDQPAPKRARGAMGGAAAAAGGGEHVSPPASFRDLDRFGKARALLKATPTNLGNASNVVAMLMGRQIQLETVEKRVCWNWGRVLELQTAAMQLCNAKDCVTSVVNDFTSGKAKEVVLSKLRAVAKDFQQAFENKRDATIHAALECVGLLEVRGDWATIDRRWAEQPSSDGARVRWHDCRNGGRKEVRELDAMQALSDLAAEADHHMQLHNEAVEAWATAGDKARSAVAAAERTSNARDLEVMEPLRAASRKYNEDSRPKIAPLVRKAEHYVELSSALHGMSAEDAWVASEFVLRKPRADLLKTEKEALKEALRKEYATWSGRNAYEERHERWDKPAKLRVHQPPRVRAGEPVRRAFAHRGYCK